MKVVFISGPYRGNIAHNIKVARKHAEALWQRGYAVFCPHLNSARMDGIAPDENFLNGDLEILKRCDAIYLIPGWEQSAGAKKEVQVAEAQGLEKIKTLSFERGTKHRERLIPDNRNVIPPLLEDVVKYCKERNRGVDPKKWWDSYQAKGWLIGKTKMVDWQAAVRTWEKEDTNGTQPLDAGRGSNPLRPLIKRYKTESKNSATGWKDEQGIDCEPPRR